MPDVEPSRVIARTGSTEWRQSEPKTIELYNTDRNDLDVRERMLHQQMMEDQFRREMAGFNASQKELADLNLYKDQAGLEKEQYENSLIEQQYKDDEAKYYNMKLPSKHDKREWKRELRRFEQYMRKDGSHVEDGIDSLIGSGALWVDPDDTGGWSTGVPMTGEQFKALAQGVKEWEKQVFGGDPYYMESWQKSQDKFRDLYSNPYRQDERHLELQPRNLGHSEGYKIQRPQETPKVPDKPEKTKGYQYGDRGAMQLMKWAKHDPETEGITHAVRRKAPKPVTIYTERFGKKDSPETVRDMDQVEHGDVWNIRGLYRPEARTIDVHHNADANATLGHELVHHLLETTNKQIGGQAEEAFASYLARNPPSDWAERLTPDQRSRLRDLAVEILGPDIRRGRETDLSKRPDAISRLNAKTKQERESREPVKNLLKKLKDAGLDAYVEE